MTALSAIRKIFMLTTGDKFNPITTTSTQAQSIEDAMFAVPVPVSSAAERITVWGNTPPQGASVFRRDTGDTERYFDTYSAASNPGGRTPAGWYAENVKVRTASYTATGVSAQNNAVYKIKSIIPVAGKTVNNDFCTIPSDGIIRLRPGLYSMSVSIRLRTPAEGRTLLEIVDANDPINGVITRVSVGVGEDMTTLVNGNLYAASQLDVQIDYFKIANVQGGLPAFNFDVTKIG